MATKKIYLDVCCWNRPFDDQTQPRVHMESEAVLTIVTGVERGDWILILSEAVELEVSQLTDTDRRERLQCSIPARHRFHQFDAADFDRAMELEKLGFRGMDALHVAAAEGAGADVLLTTDDKLLNAARRHTDKLRLSVENPLIWLQNVLREKL